MNEVPLPPLTQAAASTLVVKYKTSNDRQTAVYYLVFFTFGFMRLPPPCG